MDLNWITEYYIPIVLIICLCVGFVMKKWIPADNKWIPTVMLILGAVLGCIADGGITLESVGYGAVTGLASTGLHQVFSQLINGGGGDKLYIDDVTPADDEGEDPTDEA